MSYLYTLRGAASRLIRPAPAAAARPRPAPRPAHVRAPRHLADRDPLTDSDRGLRLADTDTR